MDPTTMLAAAGAAGAFALALPRAKARLLLSRAKHPSLTGHARWSQRVAKLVPFYEYDEALVFRVDGAPEDVEARRRDDFHRLAALYRERFPRTLRATADAEAGLSDLQLTSRNRVPFQFARFVKRHLRSGAFAIAATGRKLVDLDGNRFFDLTGSYGLNAFGYDFYRECVDRGIARTRELGPVLGSFHPLVADNVARLRRIARKDEVSFHMSGTEAVMQAVRLARYHTRRSHIVRFCGAYHGWWDEVQPGVGSPRPARETYTLREMDERALEVIRTRRDIACVLVNPLQALHPNSAAPSDATLVGGARRAGFDREAYADWLRRLRAACDANGVVLILDEVFLGFRVARGGVQEWLGVDADLVTYGKTLGGGLPVGVVCGKARLMKRYREDRPVDVCFARGTFNSHPYVMGAMNEFLRRLEDGELDAGYADQDARWSARAKALNARLRAAGLPVSVAHLQSIWTVLYDRPSRYNWMFQHYLRLHGLALSWVGTGRLIFSLDYTDEEFAEVADRFVAAAQAMDAAGWWWAPPAATEAAIGRGVLREMLRAALGRPRREHPGAGDGGSLRPGEARG